MYAWMVAKPQLRTCSSLEGFRVEGFRFWGFRVQGYERSGGSHQVSP